MAELVYLLFIPHGSCVAISFCQNPGMHQHVSGAHDLRRPSFLLNFVDGKSLLHALAYEVLRLSGKSIQDSFDQSYGLVTFLSVCTRRITVLTLNRMEDAA